MKPLHASHKRLSRCPCCQSKYSKGARKGGKTSARMRSKLAIKKELSHTTHT